MSRIRIPKIGVALGLFAASAIGWQLVNVAARPSVTSSFVLITPCRLVDTRTNDQVGVRGSPIGTQETASFPVFEVQRPGDHPQAPRGNCRIPNHATGIVANVTAVNPTAASFLTLFPGDATQPLASNLNWTPSSPPTPNQVTVGLSQSGLINLFNAYGTVDVIIDISGYYIPESAGPAGPPGPVSGRCSATLRWDLPACKAATFITGLNPRGVAFDGTNIWVANQFGDSISKFNPATGARSDYNTGRRPVGVAFDGTSIWVTNMGSNTVSKIDPNSLAPGSPINYNTGTWPVAVAADGSHIWVVNYLDGTVSKIDPNVSAPGTPVDYATGPQPNAVAFDGTNVWVTNTGGSTVSRINTVTGTKTDFTTGVGPYGVAFDGTSIWVASGGTDTLSKIDPNSVAPGTPISYSVGSNPREVAFDGTDIWVTNSDGTVSKVDGDGPAPGTPITYTVGADPRDIAFDGNNIWVTNNGANTVSKLVP